MQQLISLLGHFVTRGPSSD